MNIDDYADLDNVTIAEFHEAIFCAKKQMQECVKNKNLKGALEQVKIYLKLNQLLNKKVFSVRKNNKDLNDNSRGNQR